MTGDPITETEEMSVLEPKPSLGDLGGLRRRKLSISAAELITRKPLREDSLLPLVLEPATEGIDVSSWARENRALLDDLLDRHGGLLFRGFALDGEGGFAHFIDGLTEARYEYTYRSTPRRELSEKIYTSTEYPSDQSIPMHNEMSYTSRWPLRIWFYCALPSEQGGETPIADGREVYRRIDPALRQRFADQKVMYVRNYGDGFDLRWQEVFQTDDRLEVDAFCRANEIDFEWRSNDRLRTRQVCQAVAKHPRTNEMVWFNQAHLFHVTSLAAEVRDSLLSVFGEDGLPRNTYYGDGSPIESSALDEIRGAYESSAIVFSWQAGDLVMLDNMLTAHGRKPYRGARKILVGMANPYGLDA